MMTLTLFDPLYCINLTTFKIFNITTLLTTVLILHFELI